MSGGPTDVTTLEPTSAPDPSPPPARQVAPREWVRENLFSTWYNSLLTVVFGALIVWVIFGVARFVFVTAQWEIVRVNLTNFMVGRLSRDLLPRVWGGVGVLALTIGLLTGLSPVSGGWRERVGNLRRAGPLVFLVVVFLSLAGTATPWFLTLGTVAVAVAGYGCARFLPAVIARRAGMVGVVGVIASYLVVSGGAGPSYAAFGGLLLTLFLALGGIVLSFPFGLLLGLGRRSTFPAVRVVCVGYIELIRGVPLITLLFMSGFALGFFLPPGMSRPELVTRALVALVLFTAAYVAEIVRGGLQGVPAGQTEAAQAIGLSPLRTTYLIVLPQALRNVIPALVGQFISLFKDTSLVTFLGLLELLGVAQVILEQPDFRGAGLQTETLIFASLIYWSWCYSMSRASQRLETRLGVGER